MRLGAGAVPRGGPWLVAERGDHRATGRRSLTSRMTASPSRDYGPHPGHILSDGPDDGIIEAGFGSISLYANTHNESTVAVDPE